MSSAFRSELLAINSLRAKFPGVGQRTLATQIVNRDFVAGDDKATARNTGQRSFASTYAAIRRYDKANGLNKPVLQTA